MNLEVTKNWGTGRKRRDWRWQGEWRGGLIQEVDTLDYPDAYTACNIISSIGSIISFVGVIIFIFILWERISTNRQILFPTQTRNSVELFQNTPLAEHIRRYSEWQWVMRLMLRISFESDMQFNRKQIAQKIGKESENSYRKMKRSPDESHT